jgi:hypothetical protein
MSVKDTLKKVPAKLQKSWAENKDSIKNTTIIVLATTTTLGYVLLKAVAQTRNDYLESMGLTQDFYDYLTSVEE